VPGERIARLAAGEGRGASTTSRPSSFASRRSVSSARRASWRRRFIIERNPPGSKAWDVLNRRRTPEMGMRTTRIDSAEGMPKKYQNPGPAGPLGPGAVNLAGDSKGRIRGVEPHEKRIGAIGHPDSATSIQPTAC